MVQFGELPADGRARERAGAYAVVRDADGRVAVVTIGGGAHLPGGGIDPGEGPEEALHRELAEETGMTVAVVSELGIARQVVHWKGEVWNKIGHFFLCRPLTYGAPTDPAHVLDWWPANRARDGLAHAYYGWAVGQAQIPC